MKNVTITLEEEVAVWIRVLAAKRETSVSRLVGDVLREEMLRDQAYQSNLAAYLSRPPTKLKDGGGYPHPPRNALHER